MAKNRTLAILTVILAIVVIVTGAFIVLSAKDKAVKEPVAEPEQTEEAAVEDPATLEATLFFASDYQKDDQGDPKDNLTGIVNAVRADKSSLDGAVFCGDYSNVAGMYNHEITPENAIADIKEVMTGAYPDLTEDNMIFTQGNHDAMTISIAAPGLHEFDDYLVYVNNTEIDFPWQQGKTAKSLYKVTHTKEVMKETFDKLRADGETRPIIVAQHVPLHFTARTSSLKGTGDNLYSSLIFDVVNDAATDLNIIYVTGHNHSSGWDNYVGGSCYFKQAGDTILIPDFNKDRITTDSYKAETLNFTYLNAGYTGYCKSNGADTTLTGTVCEIYDSKIVFTKYSADGVHQICGAGAACEDPSDTGLIPSDQYSKQMDSPVTVERK
ncbi:MAG: metallophosphoesterase [Bacillota bacterium]